MAASTELNEQREFYDPFVPAKAGTQILPLHWIPACAEMNGKRERHAARLPNRSRLAFCCALRGVSLNRRAALPPRILCLAFSERNGRSQIRLGTSKSQCGESDA